MTKVQINWEQVENKYGRWECMSCGFEGKIAQWERLPSICGRCGIDFMTSAFFFVPVSQPKEVQPKEVLQATEIFPSTISQVLSDDAPVSCKEFQQKFTTLLFVINNYKNTKEGDALFKIIPKDLILKKLQSSGYESTLKYALEKGWVEYKKERQIINIDKDLQVWYKLKNRDIPYRMGAKGIIERIEIE